jgi:phosphoserine phosphatase RsbU/P
MKILIAERDPYFRRMVEHMLISWEHDVMLALDHAEILALLGTERAPDVALLDSALAPMDGFHICRKIRESSGLLASSYVIMLLRRSVAIQDVFAASLDAGADDYICKPFDPEELRSRLRVGARVIGLRRNLGARERELAAATLRIKELQEPLPEGAPASSVDRAAMSAQAGAGGVPVSGRRRKADGSQHSSHLRTSDGGNYPGL